MPRPIRAHYAPAVRLLNELSNPQKCALVPTMGALHAGHEALIRRACELASRRALPGGCVVTIFVNPTQFNEQADFQRYPRTIDADAVICKRAGATTVLAPSVQTVYPDGTEYDVADLPGVATRPGLEDAHRPGHFAGVCQVVKRLFELTNPAVAVFGEKDWQQLQVVKAMVAQLALPIEIDSAPTVREPDGLAMSSRNRFLSPEYRERALSLFRALGAAAKEKTFHAAEARMAEVLVGAGVQPEYAVIRDAESLMLPDDDTDVQMGQTFVEMGLATRHQVDRCMEVLREYLLVPARPSLAQILLDKGFFTREQFSLAINAELAGLQRERTGLRELESAAKSGQRVSLSAFPAPLSPIPTRPRRALVAARVGSVRLIDNAPWSPANP